MNEILILLIIPAIIFIWGIAIREVEGGFYGAFGVFILELCAIFMICITRQADPQTWETAQVYKIINAEELTLIELPNYTVEIWKDKEKLYTLTSAEEYSNRNNIEKIEYRKKEMFGRTILHVN